MLDKSCSTTHAIGDLGSTGLYLSAAVCSQCGRGPHAEKPVNIGVSVIIRPLLGRAGELAQGIDADLCIFRTLSRLRTGL